MRHRGGTGDQRAPSIPGHHILTLFADVALVGLLQIEFFPCSADVGDHCTLIRARN